MSVRKFLFWVHLIAGLLAGLVILVMSATGVLLTYEAQVIAWEERAYRIDGRPRVEPPISMDVLVERVAAEGAPVTTLFLNADPAWPVVASRKDGQIYFVAPDTGEVLGQSQVRPLVAFVRDIHRTLGFGQAGMRDVGTSITGASNVLFLLLALTGLVLWWPRKWSPQALRAVTVPDFGKTGRAREWNWHHVVGFWGAPTLIVVVASATMISYPGMVGFAEQRLIGDAKAKAALPVVEVATAATAAIGLDDQLALIARQAPDWASMRVILPSKATPTTRARIVQGEGLLPYRMANLTIDGETGAVTQWRRYQDGNPVQKARTWGRWLHTGEALGVVGQTVAGLASAGGVILVWTGVALSWRRYAAYRQRKRQPKRDSVSTSPS